jgi:hypothetical protein
MNNKIVVFSVTDLQGKSRNNKTEIAFQIIKHTCITQRLLIVFSITDLQGKSMNNKTEIAFQIIKHTCITQRLLIKKKKKKDLKKNNKTHVETYLKIKNKRYIKHTFKKKKNCVDH